MRAESEIKPNSKESSESETNEKGTPPRVAELIAIYHGLSLREGIIFEENQARAAIALAALTDDPCHLPHLAERWGVKEDQVRVIIRDVYYDEKVKKVGFEIFDYKKKRDKQLGKNIINVEDIIHDTLYKLPVNILTDREKELMKMVHAQLSNEEIAEIFGIKPHSVAISLVRLRRKIEPYIFDAGLIRVSEYKDSALTTSAAEGRIDAKKVLRIYYTLPSIADSYLKKKRSLDKGLLRKGYIPLSDRSQITPQEHSTLLGLRHRGDIIRKNNRAYVSKEYLEQFRSGNVKRKSHTSPPSEHHKLLSSLIPDSYTRDEQRQIYRSLLYYAKNRSYPSIQLKRRWYVNEDDIQPYLTLAIERVKNHK